ncbi:MAG: hypothetical protein OD817_03455 [Gammaproteobacteria bacterium]
MREVGGGHWRGWLHRLRDDNKCGRLQFALKNAKVSARGEMPGNSIPTKHTTMQQRDQVIAEMRGLGGYATFGQLYQRVRTAGWKTKTPFASIRRIVQDEKTFFKIRPGLWALQSHKTRLPEHVYSQKSIAREQAEEYGHAYYQGLLLELGNLQNYDTFVPRQDKNKKFLDTTLGSLGTMNEIFSFGYPDFVRQVNTIDVSWFNSRKMPACLFEVEHSTQMDRSLIKFNELTDFNVRFFIVADQSREKEFASRARLHTFKALENRVKFYDYEKLSKWHANCFENKAVSAL